VGLVRTDVSDEFVAYIFRVERIRELGTNLKYITNCLLVMLTFFLAL
jgi:hypothetical protein